MKLTTQENSFVSSVKEMEKNIQNEIDFLYSNNGTFKKIEEFIIKNYFNKLASYPLKDIKKRLKEITTIDLHIEIVPKVVGELCNENFIELSFLVDKIMFGPMNDFDDNTIQTLKMAYSELTNIYQELELELKVGIYFNEYEYGPDNEGKYSHLDMYDYTSFNKDAEAQLYVYRVDEDAEKLVEL